MTDTIARAQAAKALQVLRGQGAPADKAALQVAIDAAMGALKAEGYRIIASNPAMYLQTSALSAVPLDQTHRTRHHATADASAIRLVYGNFANIGGITSVSDGYSDITVGASLQKSGTTSSDQSGYTAQAWFKNGSTESMVARGALVVTEPAFFNVAKGEPFYINTHSCNLLPASPAAAPTLSEAASGGTLVGGATYNVCLVYVFPNGVESATSAGAGQPTTAGANTRGVVVAAPPAVAGAIGWRAYVTGRNAAIGGQYFRHPGTQAFGANLTITAENAMSNVRQARAGGLTSIPGSGYIFGGLNFAGLDTGEGRATGDATFGALPVTVQPGNAVYSPLAVLGKVKGPLTATFAIIGDSINAASGDHGWFTNGGHCTRAICDQMQLRFNKDKAPLYGYVRVPLGGEQARQFAATLNSNSFARSRLAITELADCVLSNYGNNDTGFGLADMKASILQIAAWYIARGIKFAQCTLMPNTDSVNGWTNVAGQTVKSTEGVRTAFNDWLRDPSAAGFLAQAGGKLVAVADICKYTEVNAAGVLTLNGGFWRVPDQTPRYSGTVTSAPSATQFTDSGLASTAANTWMGYNVLWTSGAAAGKTGCILYQNAGVVSVSTTPAIAPSVGDTFDIRLIATVDGLHPASQGHIWAAQAIQEVLPNLAAL